MAWETSLDRLVLRQINLAERGEVQDRDIVGMVGDLLSLNGKRPQSWFHSGYARALLGVESPDPGPGLPPDCLRWFVFGRLKGHLRRGDAAWLKDISEDEGLLVDLIADPAIAAQILPSLMGSYFQDGNFEKAVWVLRLLEARLDLDGAGAQNELVLLSDAALSDLLARIERRQVDPEEVGALRRALRRVLQIDRFGHLSPTEQARFHRALGTSLLSTGEWDEARNELEKARDLAKPGERLHKQIHLLLTLTHLRVMSLYEVSPDSSCVGGPEAMKLLAPATAKPNPLPAGLYLRGMLSYEQNNYDAAIKDLEAAVKTAVQEAVPDDALLARARFFLGAALLLADRREEAKRAARMLEESLGRIEPQLANFYPVYDALRKVDQKVSLRYLDAVELGRGAAAEDLLLLALEYQSLGEPEPAIRAANRVLEMAGDLDQRIEAHKVLLTAHNMQGSREQARNHYIEMRELLTRRGAFAELEKLLKDEDLVGQALDHVELKCELADLYEEMEDRDWDRANLRLAIARTMRARKEVEDLHQAIAMLQEVAVEYPELAQDELAKTEKLLELKGKSETMSSERELFASLAESLGHKVKILVVGGNERQRRHHPRLDELASEWDFDGEWLMANYSSPQRVVDAIGERIKQGIDVLVLLHWNRHETTEPALELARSASVPARTVFYAGFTSLQVCLLDLASKLLNKQGAAN